MSETELLRAKLNRETGRTGWTDLEPHYRRGAVIHVNTALDLVDVAVRIAEDDTVSVKRWMKSGDIARLTPDQAAEYHRIGRIFWAVVVAPWVLIQEEAPRC